MRRELIHAGKPTKAAMQRRLRKWLQKMKLWLSYRSEQTNTTRDRSWLYERKSNR